MQIPNLLIEDLIIGDIVYFISKHTATRVVTGKVYSTDSTTNTIIVNYKDNLGGTAKNRVLLKNIIRSANFETRGRKEYHTFCLINLRNSLIIAPIHSLSEKMIHVALGGHILRYRKTSIITGFLPNIK